MPGWARAACVSVALHDVPLSRCVCVCWWWTRVFLHLNVHTHLARRQQSELESRPFLPCHSSPATGQLCYSLLTDERATENARQ